MDVWCRFTWLSDSGFGVLSLGFRVLSLGFKVKGFSFNLGFGAQGLELRALASRFRDLDLEFRG